jgi:hypothetical protein
MGTFICWSGDRSKQVAVALRESLLTVLPGEIFFLSTEIETGTLWFETIQIQLEKAAAAVICITPENVNSAWMHFEVGTIFAKGEKSRLLTYLFDLEPRDIVGPLSAFQSSQATKEGTKNLVKSLAKLCGRESEDWAARFEANWGTLDALLAATPPLRVRDLIVNFGEFMRYKTFREPLEECSDQGWLDRLIRLVEVIEQLRNREKEVYARCNPRDAGLFKELIGDLDAYLRALRGALIVERRFKHSGARIDFSSPDERELGGGEPVAWLPEQVKQLCKRIGDKVDTLNGKKVESYGIPVE